MKQVRCLFRFEFIVTLMKKLLLSFILLLWPVWAGATTYYVANAGNDSCNGTSSSLGKSGACAWQTIAHVNAHKFNPGDSILFQSGGTWREQLTVASSGSSGNPITFGAYGSGNAPVINGANPQTGWAANVKANVYDVPIAAQPNQVFLSGVRATQGISIAALTQNQWYYSGGLLYFYEGAGNPDRVKDVITASQQLHNIDVNGQSYLTIQGLNLQNANGDAIYFRRSSSNVNINGITETYAYQSGIRTITGAPVTNSTFENSTWNWNGADGIFIGKSSHDLTIQGNRFEYNSQFYDGIGDHGWSGGLYMWCNDNSITNVIVQNNISAHNGVYPDGSRVHNSGAYVGGVGLWFDTIRSVAGNYTDSCIMRYNYVYDNNYIGLQFEHTGYQQAYYNIVANTVGYGIRVGDYSHEAPGSYNNLVYNNVIYGSTIANISSVGTSTGAPGSCVYNMWKNNVSIGSTGYSLEAQYGGENDGTNGYGNVYTYNDFGPQASRFIQWGTGVNFSTYSAWETARGNCGSTGCSHSVEASALFSNGSGNYSLASDFTLRPGSPAIYAGVNVGLTSDYAGNQVHNPPSIGAYEYGETVPAAPQNLRIGGQ
jgi:hypothetical protein